MRWSSNFKRSHSFGEKSLQTWTERSKKNSLKLLILRITASLRPLKGDRSGNLDCGSIQFIVKFFNERKMQFCIIMQIIEKYKIKPLENLSFLKNSGQSWNFDGEKCETHSNGKLCLLPKDAQKNKKLYEIASENASRFSLRIFHFSFFTRFLIVFFARW